MLRYLIALAVFVKCVEGFYCSSSAVCSLARNVAHKYDFVVRAGEDDPADPDDPWAELQKKMQADGDAFAEGLMGKLGETNDGRLKEMDRQIEDYEMDIKQRAGKLGDEQRILNLGIDALKDFATEVIMGKSSIYQDMDLSKKKIDLMAQTDAADLRDALWGKGALSPEAKRAKAGLMSAVDQVRPSVRFAPAAAAAAGGGPPAALATFSSPAKKKKIRGGLFVGAAARVAGAVARIQCIISYRGNIPHAAVCISMDGAGASLLAAAVLSKPNGHRSAIQHWRGRHAHIYTEHPQHKQVHNPRNQRSVENGKCGLLARP